MFLNIMLNHLVNFTLFGLKSKLFIELHKAGPTWSQLDVGSAPQEADIGGRSAWREVSAGMTAELGKE